uniref:CSON002607 protein n=1 Tax=Culicoides sonorensis TaxID=179676 RepID=A0A336MN33_CULSO
MYPSFHFLRPAVVFAAIITTLQSLTWIAMALTSIIAYYCHISMEMEPQSNVKSLLGLTFYRQYFYKGDCTPNGFDNSLFSILDSVNIVKPIDIHAISWTYLALSFIWFVSGLLLLVFVNKKNLKLSSFFIYFWVFNTLIISIADLIIGIFMARDYSIISDKLAEFIFGIQSSESISVMLQARTVSWIMLGIAFRGFVIWFINVLLACYLISHVFAIQNHNRVKSGYINNAYMHNETRHSSHIIGYDPFAPKMFYGNGSTTDIPRPQINKAQTLNNQQRAAALSLHLEHNPEKEFSYLHGGRSRPTSLTFSRGYNPKQNNIPNPDYSPELPRALRLPDSIIDEHPQRVLRNSKIYKRY